MAKRTLLTPEKKAEFTKHLAQNGNVCAACRCVGISRQGAYDAREADEEFAEAWDEAVAFGLDALEEAARTRAINGVDEPVFHQGEAVKAFGEPAFWAGQKGVAQSP